MSTSLEMEKKMFVWKNIYSRLDMDIIFKRKKEGCPYGF